MVPTDAPVVYGPFEKNRQAVQYAGAGWAAFKGMMDYQRDETLQAEKMLSHIKKVRDSRCEYSTPADPRIVAEYASFADGLREAGGNRPLTDVEKAIIEEVDEGGGTVASRSEKITQLQKDRHDKIIGEVEADLDLLENQDIVATQIYSSDPDTGKMDMQVAFMPTDEAESRDDRDRANRGSAVIVSKKTTDGKHVNKVAGSRRRVPAKSKTKKPAEATPP